MSTKSAQISGLPVVRPMLVGVLVDVSGSMTKSISNRGADQSRLASFQEAFEGFIRDSATAIQRQSKDAKGNVKLFAYGFGFGGILSIFTASSGPAVRDLFALPAESGSTIDIVKLAEQWPRYKAHVESLVPQMFGSTPMMEAFQIVRERFKTEAPQPSMQKVLFVLSDGEPDAGSEIIVDIANDLKASGTLIVSCYVTDSNVTEPRHIYGGAASSWSPGAKLMFECASILPGDSPFDSYLREYGWRIDKNGRMFTQINQSEVLAEFMNVIVSPLKGDTNQTTKDSDTRSRETPQPSQAPQMGLKEPPMSLTHHDTRGKNPEREVDPGGAMPDDQARTGLAAWVFGGMLVLFFMYLIVGKPQEQFGPAQQKLLKILASVFVGVISAFFTGNLKLQGKVPLLNDLQIGTIGGFGGFALTFFLW